MAKSSEKGLFNIISYRADRWLIETVFHDQELDEETMLERFREIKNDLSHQVNVPPALLFFANLIEKKRISNGYKVKFDIIRKRVKGGRPVIKTQAIVSPQGIIFPNMKATIDLFYVDPFDNQIKVENLTEIIEKSIIQKELVRFEQLKETFEILLKDQQPQPDFLLAEGKLPDIGEDSEIEFMFNAEQIESKMNKLMGATKVFSGDLLCSLQPPKYGKEKGYDITGKVIPPLSGTPVELVSGNHTRLSEDGLACYALNDGVAIIERETITKEDRHGFKRPHIIFKISIEPLRIVDGATVTELITDDHLEVSGKLAKGAKIISKGKILIDGEVSDGSRIESKDNLYITGKILNSVITSVRDLTAEGDVEQCKLSSEEMLKLKGKAILSDLRGRIVIAKEVQASNVKAIEKVEIGKIAALEKTDKSKITKIEVEAKEFFIKQVDDNTEIIQKAARSLFQILELLGPDLAEQVGSLPASIILLRFIGQEKRRGREQFTRDQIDAIKRLVETAEPLSHYIDAKQKIIEDYKKRIERTGSGKSIVKIKEKISSDVEVTIGDQIIKLEKSITPLEISYNPDQTSTIPFIVPSDPEKPGDIMTTMK